MKIMFARKWWTDLTLRPLIMIGVGLILIWFGFNVIDSGQTDVLASYVIVVQLQQPC